MKGIVLAAGFGTRLHPLARDVRPSMAEQAWGLGKTAYGRYLAQVSSKVSQP